MADGETDRRVPVRRFDHFGLMTPRSPAAPWSASEGQGRADRV